MDLGFEQEVIDRLARMETKMDSYRVELGEIKIRVSKLEAKIYSIGVIAAGVAMILPNIVGKYFNR